MLDRKARSLTSLIEFEPYFGKFALSTVTSASVICRDEPPRLKGPFTTAALGARYPGSSARKDANAQNRLEPLAWESGFLDLKALQGMLDAGRLRLKAVHDALRICSNSMRVLTPPTAAGPSSTVSTLKP